MVTTETLAITSGGGYFLIQETDLYDPSPPAPLSPTLEKNSSRREVKVWRWRWPRWCPEGWCKTVGGGGLLVRGIYEAAFMSGVLSDWRQ